MKFTLEIKLGNDAMQDETDVADALKKVARVLYNGEGAIRDENGNTVGRWQFGDDLPRRIEIGLTEMDMADLADGATINAMDTDGNEHVVSGFELGGMNLEALTDGEQVIYGDLYLTYPDHPELTEG